MIQPDELAPTDVTGMAPKKKATLTPDPTTDASQPFAIGKAQGGDGPASITAPITDGIQPMTSKPSTPETGVTAPIPVPPLPTPDVPPVSDVPPANPFTPTAQDLDPNFNPREQWVNQHVGDVAVETSAQHPGSNDPTPPTPTLPVPTIAPVDPSNDLRGSTVLPGNDPALAAAQDGTTKAVGDLDRFDRQGMVDQLLAKNAGPDLPDVAVNTDVVGRGNAIRDDYLSKAGNTDVSAGPGIGMAASDRLNKYGTMLDQSVNGLNQVDRVKMAQELFDQFQSARAPEYAAAERRAKQVAAATGGLRSGRLRTSIGDLERTKANDANLEQRRLISDALAGSIQDQYNKADFLRGTEGQLADRERSTRDELRTDRNYRTGVDEGNVNRRLSTLGTATDAGRTGAGQEAAHQLSITDRKRANFESNRSNANAGADAASSDIGRRVDANRALFSDVSGEGRAQRNEVRGERDNENLMENQAFQRRLLQHNTERDDQGQDLQRALATLSAGEYGNPSDILAKLSQEGGLDPAMIAALAQSLGKGSGGQPASTGTSLPAGVKEILQGDVPDLGTILNYLPG